MSQNLTQLSVLVAYDIGFEVRLPQIMDLFSTHNRDPIRYTFINMTIGREHQPVSLALYRCTLTLGGRTFDFQTYATFYDLGALSLEFTCSLNEDVKHYPHIISQLHSSSEFLKMANDVASSVFRIATPAIVSPSFFKTPSTYIIVNLPDASSSADEIIEQKGEQIAKMLRMSDEPIGAKEIKRALNPFVSYSDNDFVFASSSVAVVFDDTCNEVIDIFELANAQSMELKYIDARLDNTLQLLYEENEKNTSFFSRIVHLFDSQFKRLNTIHLDTTIIAERIEQSYKFAADTYLVDIHELAVNKLFLHDFNKSVSRKLQSIRDIMSDLRDKAQNTRMEILEWIVILLIGFEILTAVFPKGDGAPKPQVEKTESGG